MNRLSALLLLALFATPGLLPASAHADRPPFVDVDLGSSDDAAALVGDGAASAIIVVKQVLVNSTIIQDGVNSLAVIQDSFNGNTGVFGVNQDAGNLNNQANVVAFVVGGGNVAAQNLSISIDVEEHDNVVLSTNSTTQEIIDGSFIGTTGIVGVNQSAGNGNNQINAFAMGMGVLLGTDAIVLNDIDLEVVTTDEEPDVEPDYVPPAIVDSFQDFRGVAQVTQASGNLNSVRNVLSVSVLSVGAAQP